jgi:carbon storage regulator CsrA
MLALTRKPGESIVIETAQGTITVEVVAAHGPVKLGIQAPPEVAILRSELVQREVAPATG